MLVDFYFAFCSSMANLGNIGNFYNKINQVAFDVFSSQTLFYVKTFVNYL